MEEGGRGNYQILKSYPLVNFIEGTGREPPKTKQPSKRTNTEGNTMLMLTESRRRGNGGKLQGGNQIHFIERPKRKKKKFARRGETCFKIGQPSESGRWRTSGRPADWEEGAGRPSEKDDCGFKIPYQKGLKRLTKDLFTRNRQTASQKPTTPTVERKRERRSTWDVLQLHAQGPVG